MPPQSYDRVGLFPRKKARPNSTDSFSSSKSKKQRFAPFWPWLSLSFGIVWLVPAVLVLALNFRDVIIGPSIGCLTKNCNIELHSTTQIQQAQNFQKDDQWAELGLQVAAKALDAWFCFVAASLVWTIIKRLAGQDSTNSLPVGYIHLHTECSDLRVIPKLAWGRRRDAGRKEGWNRTRLYLFITFVTLLCVLCNLMGPATAVLVLPNLEWVDKNNNSPKTWFREVLSLTRPLNAGIIPSCTSDQLIAGDYSCALTSYLATTDMIAAAAVATDDQNWPNGTNKKIPFSSLLLPPVLQEVNVSFTINFTDDYTAWIPSRQTLRSLTTDLKDYDNMTGIYPKLNSSYPDSALFNRSLQTRLLQHGPVLGQTNQCFAANGAGQTDQNWQAFNITDDQTVRCYRRNPLDSSVVWKCVPVGVGWTQFAAVSSQFAIEDAFRTIFEPALDSTGAQASNGGMMVTINAANASFDMDDATFQTLSNDFDWAAAFSKLPLPKNTVFTGPRQIFEYTRNIPFFTQKNESIPDFIFCDSQSMLGLADYSLNPSPLSNPIRLVETNVITNSSSNTPGPQPIYLHPDWTLAAWSVNSLNGSVGGRRAAARKIVVAFEGWVAAFATSADTSESDNFQSAQDFRNIHKFMGAQTMSLIPYTFFETQPKDTSLQPVLYRKAMVQIWKYDLNTSSSIFGFVIVLLGVIVVIARTIMYAIEREDMKDATEILVAALQQLPKRPSHARNDSNSSLQPPGSSPDTSLLDLEANNVDDDEEEEVKKEFPVVYISPATTPDVSGGQPFPGNPKRMSYHRRISFSR
jgi:hypothetical protein